jgi:hypothetical protein
LLKAGGASLDSLEKKFGLERDCIHRHWHLHVSDEVKASYLCGPAQLAELGEKAAIEGDSVLDYLRMIRTVLTGQLAAANEAGDGRGTAYVAGRLTQVLETIARVTGELGAMAQSVTINNSYAFFLNSPAFADLQAMLVHALADEPAALEKVRAGLEQLEAKANSEPALIEMKPTGGNVYATT